MKFIDFMNIRYKKKIEEHNEKTFKYFDDYALFLYENICKTNEEKYYRLLEYDMTLYSNKQTRSEREVCSGEWQIRKK